MRLDRVRHRDRPVAPATTVAALVDPPTRLYARVPAGVNDDLVVIVFIRSSDKSTLPLGCRPSSNKTEPTGTGHGGRRALARSAHPGLRDRAADNAAGATVARTSRALPVTPRSRHPLRGRRRSRRLRRRLSPTAEGSGPHRVGAASGHRPGPVVHRRFHRAVDEGHPRRCGHQGDYRRPDDDQRPISRGTLIRGASRMRPDHDCYEDVPPTGTPLDGDWFT